MYRVHSLPTKPTKEANPEDGNNKDAGRPVLRSVEDSLVLLQALRQSRQTWLTSAFVKFSTKSRTGKGSDIWQPPHTIRFRGKCDLEIGPHVFYATSVYEVTYQPYSAPVQAPSPYNAPSGQKVAPSGASQLPSAPASATAATVYAPSTTALVSSLKGAVPITSDLIAQVNAAAISNPTLANLLGLAASGSATSEQLQTLGVTIQSLAETSLKSATSSTQPQSVPASITAKIQSAALPNSPVPPPTFTPPTTKSSSTNTPPTKPKPSNTNTLTTQPPVLSLRPPQAPIPNTSTGQAVAQLHPPQQMQVIHKEPDVVIEFYENSYDRWTLPKDLVLYERVKRWDGNNSLADIIFSTIFPFEGSKPTVTPPAQSTEPPPVPKDVVHPITLRFFNVPPAIWNLFSSAAGNEERTKRIKASIDSQLDKAAPRAYLQHCISDGTLLTQLQASASDRYPTKTIRPTAPVATTTQAKRRAPATPKDGSPAGGPTSKRKRTTQVKKMESKTGTCDICKRASIVLAPDSPYCPPCTKKVGVTSTGVPVPSSGVSVVAGNGTPLPQTAAGSTISQPPLTPTAGPKPKKQKQPGTAVVFKHSPLQAQYTAAGRPPVPNYYAWQAQGPYAYHPYHQPQAQPHPGQSQPPQAQPALTPVHPPQPPLPAPPPSTQKKSDLAAMD